MTGTRSQFGMPREAVLLGVGIFFAIAATNILTPLLPTITGELGITYAEAGLVVTAYVFARLIASVICGLVANWMPATHLAFAAIAMLIVGPIVGLVAIDVTGLVASRLIAGSGTGILVTLGLTALGSVAPAASRGRVMSVFQVAHNAGIAVYPLLGGIIGASVGWRATFVVVAVGAVVAGAVLIPVFRRTTRAATDAMEDFAPDQVPIASRRRSLALLITLTGVFATMFNRHGFRNTVLPLYAGTALGLGAIEISTGIAVMSLIGLVIAIPGAMSGDRWGHRRLIALGLVMLAAGDLTFLLTHDYATFMIAAIALGCGDFFIGSQSALIASLASPRGRARALGGFRLATDLGALAGPVVLAGAMAAMSPAAAMVLAAAVLFLSGIFTRLAVPALVFASTSTVNDGSGPGPSVQG